MSELRITSVEDNPLDRVEDVLSAHNWVFERMNDEELIVEVRGKACNYRLFFIWQEDMNALQFCAQYDMSITDSARDRMTKTLANINEDLWMGHFDLPRDTGVPSFRHTCLIRGMNDPAVGEMIEDMMDIALVQCERHYAAFDLLSKTEANDDNMISLALMETMGES